VRDHSLPRSTFCRNFDFLKGLETDFTKEFSSSRIGRAKALSMQKQFLPSIRSKMHYYNINRTKLRREQKVQSIIDKIDDMKTVLDANIRLMVKRQEGQLDEMLEKSETMKQDTVVFKKRAEVMLLSARRRQFARTITCTLIGLGAIYLLLAAGCGFTFSACHPKTSSS
jgi:Synaptobrevin